MRVHMGVYKDEVFVIWIHVVGILVMAKSRSRTVQYNEHPCIGLTDTFFQSSESCTLFSMLVPSYQWISVLEYYVPSNIANKKCHINFTLYAI